MTRSPAALKPRVWNRRDPACPKDAVYVGRPTKWGNPYTHLGPPSMAGIRVHTRQEAIAGYREHLAAHPDLVADARRELRGRHLVCWCAPAPCHADVLLEVANS